MRVSRLFTTQLVGTANIGQKDTASQSLNSQDKTSSTNTLLSSNSSQNLSTLRRMPQTYNPISIADDPIPTCKLTQHVDDNYIPDDIVNAALNIMREQSDETFLLGQLTPAEMELAIVSNMPLLITQHRRQCINIHHVNDHWVTSIYDPVERNITVYDSLKSMDRISQLQKQLNILYGYVPKIHYIPIKQQGNETT